MGAVGQTQGVRVGCRASQDSYPIFKRCLNLLRRCGTLAQRAQQVCHASRYFVRAILRVLF